MEDFVVARNPDGASSLPFLVRLPLRSGPVVLKVRETWPRMSKVYCHPSQDWPADPLKRARVLFAASSRSARTSPSAVWRAGISR